MIETGFCSYCQVEHSPYVKCLGTLSYSSGGSKLNYIELPTKRVNKKKKKKKEKRKGVNMPNKDYTDITFIIDKSGSMLHLTMDTIGGFNSFVNGQKNLPGKCVLSLVQFNGRTQPIYTGLNINHVAPLGPESYKAEGWTALLDALGDTMVGTGRRFAAMYEEDRPGKVLFVIITDGQENYSTRYNKSQIKEMIKQQEDVYGWNFTFMGANLASVQEAQSLGFVDTHQYSYTSSGVASVYTAMNANVKNFRGSSLSVYNTSVTPEEVENQNKT